MLRLASSVAGECITLITQLVIHAVVSGNILYNMKQVPNEILIEEVNDSIIISFTRRKIGFSDYFVFLFSSGFFVAAIFNFFNTDESAFFFSYAFLFLVLIIMVGFFASLKEKQKIVINENSIEIIEMGLIPFRKVMDKKEIDRIYLRKVKMGDYTFNPFLMLKSYSLYLLGDYYIPQIVYKGDNYSFINHYSKRTKVWLVDYLIQNM
jgi:hypothetical protein